MAVPGLGQYIRGGQGTVSMALPAGQYVPLTVHALARAAELRAGQKYPTGHSSCCVGVGQYLPAGQLASSVDDSGQ